MSQEKKCNCNSYKGQPHCITCAVNHTIGPSRWRTERDRDRLVWSTLLILTLIFLALVVAVLFRLSEITEPTYTTETPAAVVPVKNEQMEAFEDCAKLIDSSVIELCDPYYWRRDSATK